MYLCICSTASRQVGVVLLPFLSYGFFITCIHSFIDTGYRPLNTVAIESNPAANDICKHSDFVELFLVYVDRRLSENACALSRINMAGSRHAASGVLTALLRRNYSQLTFISSRKSRVSMALFV